MERTQLDESTRLKLHSGDYVKVMESLPIHRLGNLLPLMGLSGDQVLVDLACGPGVLARLVHDKVARYEGVDFSPEFVASATGMVERLGIGNARFHCSDVVDYCLAHPQSADVVTAFDFSEHIYDDEFLRIFSAARDLLKPGGTLHVYTPNGSFFYEWMKNHRLAPQFPQHVAVRTEGQNRRLLEQCGFAAGAIECLNPPHFNVFRHLHALSRLPGLGGAFRAKLYFKCSK